MFKPYLNYLFTKHDKKFTMPFVDCDLSRLTRSEGIWEDEPNSKNNSTIQHLQNYSEN